MITPAQLYHGPAIMKMGGGSHEWYRFVNYRRRTEYWDVIEKDEELIGFIHWALKSDNSRTIYDVIVHPSHQRQGYGRKLVTHVGTPVTVRTKTAYKFFRALGFTTQFIEDGKVQFYLEKEPTVVDMSKPWIMTYTGKSVNPMDMGPDDICIEDIAHALACVNRFAGHTAKPISVAQHSVFVSKVAIPASGCAEMNREIALQGLLHDASEAYLGDVTKWLKPELPAYLAAEDRLQAAIMKKFGCSEVLHPAVERADRVMVMFEATKGFGKAWPNHLNNRPGYDPPTEQELAIIGKWAPLPWRAAEDAFLVRYRACTAK